MEGGKAGGEVCTRMNFIGTSKKVANSGYKVSLFNDVLLAQSVNLQTANAI